MNKISAVIVAHNEQNKIRDCLLSLDFVDEIIVVLDKCNDRTKEIVMEFNPIIIEGSWNIEGERRNIGLQKVSKDWILEIDADERISKELKDEICNVIKTAKPCGFDLGIANFIGDRWVKYGWLRTMGVIKRNSLSFRGLKKYHQDKEIHPTYTFNGEIYQLENYIIHLVDDDISDLLNRFNRYTNWKAKDMINGKKKSPNILNLIIGFKIRFCKSYLIKKGYKEGLLGFLIAILCGLYPMVASLKMKEKINENS